MQKVVKEAYAPLLLQMMIKIQFIKIWKMTLSSHCVIAFHAQLQVHWEQAGIKEGEAKFLQSCKIWKSAVGGF